MLKSLILGLFICALWIPGLTSAQEPLGYAELCHHTWINIRAEPRMDSEVIGRLVGGERLIVLERDRRYINQRWSQIQVEETSQVGWVFSPYLVYLPLIYQVNPDHLNVRAYPGVNFEVIGRFVHGDQVQVLGHEAIYGNGGVWAYVRHTQTGQEGWVDSVYLGDYYSYWSVNNCTPIIRPAEPSAATVWRTSQPIRLYAEPYDPYRKPIAYLSDGDRLQVLEVRLPGNSKLWSLVAVVRSDLVGWIEGAPRTQEGYYPRGLFYLPLRVTTDSPLNIYAQPGQQSAVVGRVVSSTCYSASDSRRTDDIGWLYLPAAGGWVVSLLGLSRFWMILCSAYCLCRQGGNPFYLENLFKESAAISPGFIGQYSN
jgi:uncharacterized protein YgiM (DUF1202 family)